MSELEHYCHWIGCQKVVPPAMWGCKKHWYQLPKKFRNKIWATYRPGQEITKDPSPQYRAVLREVQEWIVKTYAQ